MEEQKMIQMLDRFIWYTNRNRLIEAKRVVQQELNNLNGITELQCKSRKINKNWCKICKNKNCNLNVNPEYKDNKMSDTQIIEILQEIKETIFTNDIDKCLDKVNEYLKYIKDKTLIEILKRVKMSLEQEKLYETKLYIMLELGNFKDTTHYTCKNTIYPTYDFFCKNCTNYNCTSNKNKDNENSF